MFGAAVLAFASCSNHDFSQPQPEENQQAQKYEQAFTNYFGEVNSSVNWGFKNESLPSIDWEEVAATRGHDVNHNQWGTSDRPFYFPDNVTAEEEALVLDYFEKLPKDIQNTVNVNWHMFFVYQVHKGTTQYVDGAGNTFTASDVMNELYCYKEKDMTDGEHINNFNNGNNTTSVETESRSYKPNYTIKGGTLMRNSGTADFAYSNAKESGRFYNDYIIIPGEKIHKDLAGFYYVGFDFRAESSVNKDVNTNENVERDYVFTDWIVRISPAQFIDAKRIMCEDLIASDLNSVSNSDWDFNDVVFDAYVCNEWLPELSSNKLVAHITLWAAGGTMPLYVCENEVHEMFGVDSKTMINTKAQKYATGAYKAVDGLAPVIFSVVLGDEDWSGTFNYNNIPVVVGGTPLMAYTGKSTQKIVCSPSVDWADEKVEFKSLYPKFQSYVNNGTPAEWWNE